MPVSKSASDPLTAPYQPIVPLKNLLFKALSSKKMVTKIPQPLPFIVAAFEPKTLPVNYNFGYEWRSVFKQKTHYSVVLTAFTKGEVCIIKKTFENLINFTLCRIPRSFILSVLFLALSTSVRSLIDHLITKAWLLVFHSGRPGWNLAPTAAAYSKEVYCHCCELNLRCGDSLYHCIPGPLHI